MNDCHSATLGGPLAGGLSAEDEARPVVIRFEPPGGASEMAEGATVSKGSISASSSTTESSSSSVLSVPAAESAPVALRLRPAGLRRLGGPFG